MFPITYCSVSRQEVEFFAQANSTPLVQQLLGPTALAPCDTFFGARAGARLVGAISMSLSGFAEENMPTLVSLYVTKPYRRQHVGETLLQNGVEYLRDLGFNKLFTTVISKGALVLWVKLAQANQWRTRHGLEIYMVFLGDRAATIDDSPSN